MTVVIRGISTGACKCSSNETYHTPTRCWGIIIANSSFQAPNSKHSRVFVASTITWVGKSNMTCGNRQSSVRTLYSNTCTSIWLGWFGEAGLMTKISGRLDHSCRPASTLLVGFQTRLTSNHHKESRTGTELMAGDQCIWRTVADRNRSFGHKSLAAANHPKSYLSIFTQ